MQVLRNTCESSVVITCLADTASRISSRLCLLLETSSTITVDELEQKLESDISEAEDQSENSKAIEKNK